MIGKVPGKISPHFFADVDIDGLLLSYSGDLYLNVGWGIFSLSLCVLQAYGQCKFSKLTTWII